MIEIIHRDGLARIGRFEVNGRAVETPALMPVINPNIIVISPREMKDNFGIGAIITNSYIINRDQRLRESAIKNGLHSMLDFDGIIMTDSGTFQSHVYGDINQNYLDIVNFQKNIGSDIGTILDIFSEPDFTYEQAKEAVNETYKRALESKKIKGDMYLAGPIQGSIYQDLRELSARLMDSLDLEYYPIGGVVPLLENYRYSDVVKIVMSVKMNLSFGKPVHLFGAGHPMFFPLAVLMGIDFFDSSSYVKYARDDRVLFPDSTRYLFDLKYVPYQTEFLNSSNLEELKSMEREERFRRLALHNLKISLEEIERIKASIFEGTLWEYVEERCRVHPSLYDALYEFYKYSDKLEKFESLSRKHPFYYTGAESILRPSIGYLEKRIIDTYRYKRKTCIVLRREDLEKAMKYIEKFDSHFLLKTCIGTIPFELLYIYPIFQAILPENCHYRENLSLILDSIDYDVLISWLKGVPEKIVEEEKYITRADKRDLDLLRVRAVADYQFGLGAGEELLKGDVKIVKSKNTGMIRNIYVNDKHILSMRNDGFFTLKIDGGKILHKKFKYPKLRVVVNKDSEEFNKKGKNVFARFVKEMDEYLRPFDEVLVVNEEDELIGVGRTFFNWLEIKTLRKGMVVEIRETLKLNE
ncbi:MAG: tRNA guanosine(15) transglycosylase TgtA [Thermoplasmata archaeon]|jgi:7-cyano-7-deazaguanine tRNA-ribosyltransferase